MLYDGIYEQIVNTRINKELELLNGKEYDISLEQLKADDARRILTIYISNVIEQGLKYLRDANSSKKDEEALLAQIRVCNDIVSEISMHTKEPDFEDNKILEKGEVLTALYNKMNSVRSITAQRSIRPQTSIVENALFTGSPSEPSMISELKKEIVSSDQIDLLVSFIKWSGIRPLLSDLKEFTQRAGTRLRILTTTYMRATDAKAIKVLASLPNTEIKVNYETGNERMHAKSYLFHRKTGFSTAYIGSSNISHPALTDGLEWNVKVTEKESFDIVKKFSVSFESYWNEGSFEKYDPEDENCRRKLEEELLPQRKEKDNGRKLHMAFRPYAYQEEILDNLLAEREVYGHYKNLVVAATGVGKTVIAAFDYKQFRESNPNAKLLFVAHRKEILQQSMETFQEVLNDFNFGELYVGGAKPNKLDNLFISIQSLNSADLTEWMSQDYYDFIIVDEFHHAAAKSYQKLLYYFKPKVLLGLTATPDRMDGEDILKYFDGRIASKMLLGEAIDRNLLSTFQYYGITDSVNYKDLKWINGRYDVNELESIYTGDTIRCNLIMDRVKKYVTDINSVKGLGFCVSVAHAEYMAKFFNDHDVPSIALSAQTNKEDRDKAKKRLVSGEIKFIFVVDLYNEGVDIPEIDTVLFLRPTESATVFTQQLGRGLRKAKGKECLTVLDFVGQSNKKYKFNTKYKVLAGNSRQSVKKQIEDGFSQLPRGCYIEFEEKARDYILENLKQTNNDKKELISKVSSFEADTGKPLTLDNFLTEHELTLYEFYRSDGSRSLYRLMNWAHLIEGPLHIDDKTVTDKYKKLKGLFHINSVRLLEYWIRYINGERSPKNEDERIMRNMLYYSFYRNNPKKEGFDSIDEGIESVIGEEFIKNEVLEILEYNRNHVSFVAGKNEYEYDCPIELHCSYSTDQVMAAFGYYNENESPVFREGVKYFESRKTDVFFINLNKSEKDFSPSTMYDDYAINASLFHWQSQSQDREKSRKIQRYIHHKEENSCVSLFVREFKNIGAYTSPYIFLGNADYVSHEGERPVSFNWELHEPLPAALLAKANKTIAV